MHAAKKVMQSIIANQQPLNIFSNQSDILFNTVWLEKVCVSKTSHPQLRPPQPAVYLFILDVSHNALETGYLNVVCKSLLDNINEYVYHLLST